MSDLLGLRPDDLTADEQAARDALLDSDPEARRSHEAYLEIGARVAALPHPPGPGAAHVRAVAARRRRRRKTLGVVLLAATVLLSAQLLGDPLRARGQGTPDGWVGLEAVAEGPAGLRPLADGAVVGADEQVAFRVTTEGPGAVGLIERGPAGTVQVYAAQAVAGSWFIGGDAPQVYRPDAGHGPRTYEVQWCPEEGACATSALRLVWEAPR